MKEAEEYARHGDLPPRKGWNAAYRPCAAEMLEPRRFFSLAFGSIDASFGTMGHAVAPISTESNTPTPQQVVVGSNGDIYVEGNDGIARFNAAGVLDTSYGNNGFAVLPGGDFVGEAVDSNGLLYALTTSSTGTDLTRYTTGGMVDQTYGAGGVVQVSSDTNFAAAALTVQSDEKVVVAGLTDFSNLIVFRVDSGGSLDSTFGSGGEFQDANFDQLPTGALGGNDPFGQAYVAGCSVSAQGEILIGGGSYVQYYGQDRTTARFFVVGLTAAGALDTSYGIQGVSNDQIVDTGSGQGDIPETFEILPRVFAANANGVVLVAVTPSNGLAETARLFSSSGTPVSVTGLQDQFAALGAAVLPEGGAVLLAGGVLTTVQPSGAVGSLAAVDAYNTSASGFEQSVGLASNGDLLAVGIPANGSGYEVTAFSLNPPEQIPDATVNAVTAAPDGAIDLAYYNTASNDLQFTTRLPDEQWTTPITIDASAGAGQDISIATDPTTGSLIEVAYYDTGTHSLKLATSNDSGDTFSIQTVDAGGSVGESPSIYINHRGLTAIAFYNASKHDLQLARQNQGGQWKISTIDRGGDVGSDAILVPSRTGQLSVAYSDNSRGWLKWATLDSNGVWQVQKAALAPGGAHDISMEYGTGDLPIIAFHDAARARLRVTQRVAPGEAFSTTNIAWDPAGSTSLTMQPFPDSGKDEPTLWAYDGESGSAMVYFYLAGEQDPWVAWFAYPVGATNLSLANDGNAEVAAFFDTASGDLTVDSFP